MNTDARHFATFGLPLSATRAQVKAEYRRLSLIHHPDKVPAAQKTQANRNMQVLNEAYGALVTWFDGQEEMARVAREKKRKETREREKVEREQRVREAREEAKKKERIRMESERLKEEARRAQRMEEEREEKRRVDAEEEMKEMRAAWQQTYAEAERDGRVIDRVERRAPAGANDHIVDLTGEDPVAEDAEEERIQMEWTIYNDKREARIKFSLPKKK